MQIVVLDEATSSLDSETAARIHDTIRQTFSDCTLIIIAHSMRTVLQCDRILVINAGQVSTFYHPPPSPSSLLVTFVACQLSVLNYSKLLYVAAFVIDGKISYQITNLQSERCKSLCQISNQISNHIPISHTLFSPNLNSNFKSYFNHI